MKQTIWGDGMGDFIIKKSGENINRTIRFKPELFERISLESERTGVSFNRIVNQCIEYALSNLSSTYEE